MNYLVIDESNGYETTVTRSGVEALRMKMELAGTGKPVTVIRVPDHIPELESPEQYPTELKGD